MTSKDLMNTKEKIKVFSKWGKWGTGNGEFSRPYGVAASMNGLIYVSDSFNNRIQCFDSNGIFLHTWGRRGNGNGEFDGPSGMAIGQCNGMNDDIMIAMRSIPELNVFPPGLLPICVAYMGIERLYVSDCFNNRIQAFEMDGNFVLKWGRAGIGDGKFDMPTDCAIGMNAVSKALVIYVTDTYNHRIQVFDNEGKFIRKWGGSVGQFQFPTGISVSSDGVIFIADRNGVHCYHDGRVVDGWRPSGGVIGRVWSVLVNDEMVYVSDIENHCVVQYGKDGRYVGKWGKMGSGDGEFKFPCGMAKGMNDTLYITDSCNNRIVVIDCKYLFNKF